MGFPIAALVAIAFALAWAIFFIWAIIQHFSGGSYKNFKQDTYMLDNVQGELVVSIEDEEPLTIPFYKTGELPITHNIFVSIIEEGYGRINISDIYVNGHWMFEYCPKGIAWDSRANYCINLMRTQGIASGQISKQAVEEIEKVQRNIERVNCLLEEGRLTIKHDNAGEPYYFYYV